MKCPFCLSDSKLSKEHFFSNPICEAFGIDRSMLVGSLNDNTGEVRRLTVLENKSVRLPCETCNSGWMSNLEQRAAAALSRWIGGHAETLLDHELVDVKRWLAKTAIVLAFGEVDARRFMSSPTETAIPDITTAKAVMKGESLDHVVAGAARTTDSTYLWSAGNPTVEPSGPDRISCRAVNVMALNLQPLQLWAVIPLIQPDSVELPQDVTPLRSDLPFGALRTRLGDDVQPTEVRASYSDATTTAAFAALDHLAATS